MRLALACDDGAVIEPDPGTGRIEGAARIEDAVERVILVNPTKYTSKKRFKTS